MTPDMFKDLEKMIKNFVTGGAIIIVTLIVVMIAVLAVE